MEYKEFSAKTVNDCITEACTSLGVPSDRLDYEVVSEGTSGFLGIGAKSAVIRARIKDESADVEDVKETVSSTETKKVKTEEKETVVSEKKEDNTAAEGKNASETAATVSEKKEKKEAYTDEEIAAMKAAAEKFLADVFAAMGITVTVKTDYSLLEDTLNIELSGDEMGILIGKRGQTLDSLQYLVNLVVNKGTKEYVRVKVDTENYRERRKETLENLAKNIAYKVKRTRRSVSLEPMNPNERRIIHSALQNDKYVTTHSEGEEPYRKVVVTLKKY